MPDHNDDCKCMSCDYARNSRRQYAAQVRMRDQSLTQEERDAAEREWLYCMAVWN